MSQEVDDDYGVSGESMLNKMHKEKNVKYLEGYGAFGTSKEKQSKINHIATYGSLD